MGSARSTANQSTAARSATNQISGSMLRRGQIVMVVTPMSEHEVRWRWLAVWHDTTWSVIWCGPMWEASTALVSLVTTRPMYVLCLESFRNISAKMGKFFTINKTFYIRWELKSKKRPVVLYPSMIRVGRFPFHAANTWHCQDNKAWHGMVGLKM